MDHRQMSALLIVLFAFVARIQGSPLGAPLESCTTMIPAHGFPAQTSVSPFTTETTPDADGSVKLTLLANSQGFSKFKGFLTMAFDASKPDSTDPIGYFTETNTRVNITPANYLDCPGANALKKNAATHKDNADKYVVNLSWMPSPGFSGNVTFKTTFVYNAAVFWVKTSSELVSVVAPPPPATAEPTTAKPTTAKPGENNATFAKPSLTLLAMLIGIICVYRV